MHDTKSVQVRLWMYRPEMTVDSSGICRFPARYLFSAQSDPVLGNKRGESGRLLQGRPQKRPRRYDDASVHDRGCSSHKIWHFVTVGRNGSADIAYPILKHVYFREGYSMDII
jgi:hypothetical protein